VKVPLLLAAPLRAVVAVVAKHVCELGLREHAHVIATRDAIDAAVEETAKAGRVHPAAAELRAAQADDRVGVLLSDVSPG